MNKKYEMTEKFKTVNGKRVYQIKALKDFGDVRCGDLGGWIESEKNLSQMNEAWVYGQAVVYGKVFDEAQVYGNAVVFEPVYANNKIYK